MACLGHTHLSYLSRNMIPVGWFCESCKKFELDKHVKWPVKQVEYSKPPEFCWYCASEGNELKLEYFEHGGKWHYKSECYHLHVYQLLYRRKDKTRGWKRIAWYCTNCRFFDIVNQKKDYCYGRLSRESMRGLELSRYYIEQTKKTYDKCDCGHITASRLMSLHCVALSLNAIKLVLNGPDWYDK